MNLPYLIAHRIIHSAHKAFPRTVRRVATFNVIVGVMGTLLAFFILRGFEHTITKKIYGIVGHLYIGTYTLSAQQNYLSLRQDFYQQYQANKEKDIAVMSPFVHAAAMLSNGDNTLGVLVKGVGAAYRETGFSSHLVAGTLPSFTEEKYSTKCVISEKMARILGKGVGDTIIANFLQSPPRVRRLTIAAIYNTQLAQEFDEKIVLADVRLVRKIHRLADDKAEGIEVFLHNHKNINRLYGKMLRTLPDALHPEKAQHRYPYVFDWLLLIQNNAFVFVALILLVSCFNMISSFLILTMDRYRMVGMLKVMGGSRRLVRRIFFHYATMLILRGMLWGNVITLLLAGVQYYFKLVRLDASSYSVDHLPIAWDVPTVVLGNVMVFLLLQLTVSIPIRIAARKHPTHVLRRY